MVAPMHGRLVRSPHDSKCLKGNHLGDPHLRDVLVYVPPGDGPFPVVMMLPGYAATHHNIVSYRLWQPNTIDVFDRQIAAGESKPAIVVLPDCMTRWGGSQFLDSPATGAYQTYLEEVFAHVDGNLPTIQSREARAVVGRSSGGFGALRLAMDRPELVSVVGSHAGDVGFEISMRPMFVSAAIGLEQAGGLEAFCAALPDGGPRGSAGFDAAFVVAASAAYAPEPERPLPSCALPFDPRTAELVPEVWARWLSHDPLGRVLTSRAALAEMALVFVDAGNRDEHGLAFSARLLAEGLAEVGANVVHEEYEGGHRGTSFRYERSLPLLVDALPAT